MSCGTAYLVSTVLKCFWYKSYEAIKLSQFVIYPFWRSHVGISYSDNTHAKQPDTDTIKTIKMRIHKAN